MGCAHAQWRNKICCLFRGFVAGTKDPAHWPVTLTTLDGADRVRAHSSSRWKFPDGREPPATRSHGSPALVPGTDPGVAGLLGRLWLRDSAALRHGSGGRHVPPGNDVA